MALWDAIMGRSQEEEAFSRRAVAAHPDDLKARLYLANFSPSRRNSTMPPKNGIRPW